MSKKPIGIIFNDAHLKVGNEQDIIEAAKYMIAHAKKIGVNTLFFAGDMFHSRSFQRQSLLQALDTILRLIDEAGLTLYMFPGNHDKTVYASHESFLDIYRYYPNVIFNSHISNVEVAGKKITLLPFFSDDMLIPMLEDAEGGDILISHFEMAGSTHLGNVSEKTTINKKLLSKWKKVYLGHYHNWHEITKDIVHLPSFIQDNFGEDANKGFSVIYDDLSYEIVKGRFKEFKKIVIDVKELTGSKTRELLELYGNSEDSIRIEITGEESRVKAFDKTKFDGAGIDIKTKYDSKYDVDEIEVPEEIETFDAKKVKELFKDFCNKKGYDYEKGVKLLDNFLNKK